MTTSTTVNQPPWGSEEPLTAEKLSKVWREFSGNVGPDPLAEWMKGLGFDPKEGGQLVLSEKDAEHMDFGPLGAPDYVLVTKMLPEGSAYLINAERGFKTREICP